MCVLVQFSGVIGFIFFLELTVAVLAVVFQTQVRDWVNDFVLQNIKAYRDDIDLQNLIDSMQKMVEPYTFFAVRTLRPVLTRFSLNRTTAAGPGIPTTGT